jgi:hypothetical protein
MKYLFDFNGKYIANVENGQLHATTGKNIGHLVPYYNIFIDMAGKYLGEIIYKNRFLFNKNNAFQDVNFGVYGNLGNVGKYDNPGNYGSMETISGYCDIEIETLK